MKTFNTIIGEHIFKIHFESDSLSKILMNNFPIISDAPIQFDFSLVLYDGYGEAFKNYDVTITEEKQHFIFARADYLIKVDKEYKSAIILIYDELALKHALMNLYSSFIVFNNWGLLFHSSCALENNTAHIFSGHSGAGKSTAAKLSHPRELLSDEATLVKITDDEIKIFNSPFRSEISTTNYDQTAQLGSIQILHQALVNKRVELGKADAILHLMDKVFYWVHSPEETKQIMKLLTLLVEKVSVYQLHFKKDPTFWELIS